MDQRRADAKPLLRVGHKGADALVPGNTLASFRAAVEAGVDVIELDVLRPRSDFEDPAAWPHAPAGPAAGSGPLLVAHDWADARRRAPLTLADTLDAFGESPLDRVEVDLDLKIAGREDEVVALLRERALVERAMISTMEVDSLRVLAQVAPELRRGWTLPRTTRDWTRSRWGRPLVAAALASLRARLPRVIRRAAPALGVEFVWLYHPLATRSAIAAAHASGCRAIAWTVDDSAQIEALRARDIDGICTNDPRLLAAGQARTAAG